MPFPAAASGGAAASSRGGSVDASKRPAGASAPSPRRSALPPTTIAAPDGIARQLVTRVGCDLGCSAAQDVMSTDKALIVLRSKP
jgi:hypothetical protein